MYNDLKKHWSAQYRLSANTIFADFLYHLERGGAKAQEFVETNPDLIETVAGDPEAVDRIVEMIADDAEAAENQVYFFNGAKDMLPKVRGLVQRKYDASIRFCEQLGIVPSDYTAETLLPGVRRLDDGGDVNPNPNADDTGGYLGSDDETPGDGASKTDVSEKDAVQKVLDGDTMTEDDLKALIGTLVGDGASKTDVWQAVSEYAKILGWTSRNVWTYIDEITNSAVE